MGHYALHVSSVYLEGKEYTAAAAIRARFFFNEESFALPSIRQPLQVFMGPYPQVASGIRIGAARFSTQLAAK